MGAGKLVCVKKELLKGRDICELYLRKPVCVREVCAKPGYSYEVRELCVKGSYEELEGVAFGKTYYDVLMLGPLRNSSSRASLYCS